MFRPTLNMKPYFCWSPWLSQCRKPVRNSTEVEEHWEPQVLARYRRMIILQAAARGNNRMFTQSTATDYFEQQDERRANLDIWRSARDAARAFEEIKMSYASELSYALHYERLVRKEEESKRIRAEHEAKMAAWHAEQKRLSEEDEAVAAETIKVLPATLAPAIVDRIRRKLVYAMWKARWNRLPRANRRLLKGLPLVSAGI